MFAKYNLNVGEANSMQISSYTYIVPLFELLSPLTSRLYLVTFTRIGYLSRILMISGCGHSVFNQGCKTVKLFKKVLPQ